MDHQWTAYAKGKQVAQAYLQANGLAPLHPANVAQFKAAPWPFSALAMHTHGRTFAEQLQSFKD